MRLWALAFGVLSVSVWAQAARAQVNQEAPPPPAQTARPVYEDAPPPPPADLQLKGVTADTVTVTDTVLHGLAVAEPDISARDEAPQPSVVTLRVRVSKTGAVEEVVAVHGSSELARVALEGVKTWRYRPFLVNGEPREIQSFVRVLFADGVGKRLPTPSAPVVAGMAGMAGVSAPGANTGRMSGWAGPGPGVVGMGSGQPMPTHGAVPVSGGVVAGLMDHAVAPVYPPIAKAAHVQGVVVLHALLSKTGDIEDLRVVSGPPMLTAAAVDAVKQWKYRPYLLNGAPVEVETTINVNFAFAQPARPGGLPGDTPTLRDGAAGPGAAGPGAASAAAGDGPVFVSSGMMMRYLLASSQPACSAARDASGMVVLRAIISTSGAVKSLQVVSAAKSLQECSLDAVRQWRYRPYRVDGVAKEVETMVVLDLTSAQPGDEE